LPSPIAADCFTFGLRFKREIDDVDLLTHHDESHTLRAATGPSYGRIWNAEVVAQLVKRFGDGVTGQWKVPANSAAMSRSPRPTPRSMPATGTCSCSSPTSGTASRCPIAAAAKFLSQMQPALDAMSNASTTYITEAIEAARARKPQDDLDEFLAKRFSKGMVAPLKAICQSARNFDSYCVREAIRGVMCGRRPRCKRNLACGLWSGASHVSGLFARHVTAGPDVIR
jgi:hypothetical protein